MKHILVTAEAGIMNIVLNRPQALNALNTELLQEVGQAIAQLQSDDSLMGAIIYGSGEKAFAAGADIAEFANFSPTEAEKMSRDGHQVFHSIEQSKKPVIAVVNGFALGGGCELAMSCHMRLATETARFGQPEVNLGVIPGYGGTQRLVQLIGKGKALELLMTADMIKADEALRLGLVNAIYPAESILEEAKKVLQKIGSKGPAAIAGVIECVNAYFDKSKDGYETEIRLFSESFGTAEFKEGTTAFMEKRKAAFR